MTEKAQVMKCPGCQQIVEVARYGEHMLASSPVAHSNIGVVPAAPVAPMWPVAGSETNPHRLPVKGKHFIKLWADLWKESAWGMVTFGFFMFCAGLAVEGYYFLNR